MTPPHPTDYTAPDCPRWAFDDRLAVPSALTRIRPAAEAPTPRGKAAAPGRGDAPDLFSTPTPRGA